MFFSFEKKFFIGKVVQLLMVGLSAFCMSVSTIFASEKTFVVVLDAGHGGKDPGAIGHILKLQEKSVNLKTVLKLGKLLEKEDGVKVVYTRKKDVFIELDKRAEVANENIKDGRGIFISIHVNAAESRSAKGTETYTYADIKTDVSERENSAIKYESNYKKKYENVDDVTAAIMEMNYQAAYLKNSEKFASGVEKQFVAEDRYSRGRRQAGFYVLKYSKTPAVLIELGFITNKEEEKFLSKDANVETMAEAIHNAFVRYKKDFDKRSGGSNVDDSPAKNTAPIAKNEQKSNSTKTSSQSSENENDKCSFNTNYDDVEGIRYAVQICSMVEPKNVYSRDFKGFTPVREFVGTGKYKYQYAYGNEKSLEEANKLRDEVRKKHPDAQMIVVKDGVKLPESEARKYWNSTTPEYKAINDDTNNQVADKTESSSQKSSSTNSVSSSSTSSSECVFNTNYDDVDGIRYAIQICSMAEPKNVNSRDFKGFTPVREFIGEGKYKYQYAYGNEKSLETANLMRDEVRKKHPDAQMIVVKDGVKLPMDQARKYWNSTTAEYKSLQNGTVSSSSANSLSDNTKSVSSDNSSCQFNTNYDDIDGIRYAVQICSMAEPKSVNSRDFKGFVPVREFIGTGKYKYQYAYGNEKTLEDAYRLRDEVKKKHPDAYMIVVKDGVILPMDQARKYWNTSK